MTDDHHRRIPRRRWKVAAATALVGATTAGSLLALPTGIAQAATTASVWLTTADRSNLLRQQGSVSFGGGGSGPVITVNPNATYQSMVGFGASFTDAAAWNVFNSPRRDEIMNALFNPGTGVGLSFLRQPIGATDFSRSFYTYDDGAADPSLSRFSVAHDNAYILPLVKQAKALNPKLSIMATPWSAPAWMKNNNNLIGGNLNDSRIGTYADYLVKFTQAYGAAGAPIDYLSVQNEPKFSPPGYPGMPMSSGQQVNIINTLAPKLRAAGQNAKILGYDHNWDDVDYPQQVNSGAGNNVAGSAWHCYGGDTPNWQSVVHNAQPNKDIFFTECSGTSSGDDASTFRDTLRWHGINLAIGATRNWAKSVALWNLALDNNHGPVIGSCTNCTGVVTTNGSNVTYNAEYYVLGHLSKFVQPGAVRIDSTGYGDGGIQNVAFRNPDGTIALVAFNSGGTQNFQVSYGGQSFGYSLPGGSMATFTWPGNGGTTPPPTGRTGAVSALGKCLDVTDGSTANGNRPQLWDCTSGPNQQWTLGTDGTVRGLGKCLDVTGSGTADGTAVQLWDCFGGPNQKWSAGANGSLVNAGTGKCLDVTGGGTANGTKVQIWTCTGGPNQRWTVPA
ncbi:ricin-type beta-trefoil lectin domain protein [Amycolatopsis sp. NPDC004772]